MNGGQCADSVSWGLFKQLLASSPESLFNAEDQTKLRSERMRKFALTRKGNISSERVRQVVRFFVDRRHTLEWYARQDVKDFVDGTPQQITVDLCNLSLATCGILLRMPNPDYRPKRSSKWLYRLNPKYNLELLTWLKS